MVDQYMVYDIQKVNAWRIGPQKSRIIETLSLRNYDKTKYLKYLKEINKELLLSPVSDLPNQMVAKFHEIFEVLTKLTCTN